MTRAIVIEAVRSFLATTYTGEVAIHPETNSEEMAPPYAVVRIGSAEQLYPGVAEVWDIMLFVAVFHDADATTAATAEANAAAVFATLNDPAPLYSASAASLVWTTFERMGSEASIVETRWQHIAAFRAVVAPIA